MGDVSRMGSLAPFMPSFLKGKHWKTVQSFSHADGRYWAAKSSQHEETKPIIKLWAISGQTCSEHSHWNTVEKCAEWLREWAYPLQHEKFPRDEYLLAKELLRKARRCCVTTDVTGIFKFFHSKFTHIKTNLDATWEQCLPFAKCTKISVQVAVLFGGRLHALNCAGNYQIYLVLTDEDWVRPSDWQVKEIHVHRSRDASTCWRNIFQPRGDKNPHHLRVRKGTNKPFC